MYTVTKKANQIYDELLVLKVQSGDVSAVTELVNRWQPALLGYAKIVTRDADLAAEAVQESWISSMRAIRKLQDPARFRSWLYRIVHNQCIDLIRSRQKQLKTNTEHALAAETTQTSSDMEALENEELIDHVLARMPENQRAILALFYLSELDVSEISELMKLPEGTVKSRLHKARQTFKRLSEKTSATKFSPDIGTSKIASAARKDFKQGPKKEVKQDV